MRNAIRSAPFASTFGAFMLFAVVLQRHRIVFRVRDHDIGFRNVGEHAALRDFLLQPADAPFHFGPPFRVLHLVAHFLARHLQLFVEFDELDRHIDGGDHDQRTRQRDEAVCDEPKPFGHRFRQRLESQAQQIVRLQCCSTA